MDTLEIVALDPVTAHAASQTRLATARQNLAAAKTAMAAIITQGAASGTLDDDAVKQAEADIATAERAVTIATAFTGATLAGWEAAEVEQLHQQAANLGGTYDRAAADYVDKAQEVYDAREALRLSIEDFNRAGVAVSAAHNAARMFGMTVASAARSNVSLARLDPGQHPRAAVPQQVIVRSLEVPRLMVDPTRTESAQPASVVDHVRNLLGIPAPDAAEAAEQARVQGELLAQMRTYAVASVGKGPPSFMPTEWPSWAKRR